MSGLTYAGRDCRLALYTGRGRAVVVDTRYMTAEVLEGAAAADAASSRSWATDGQEPDPLVARVASGALLASAVDGSTPPLSSVVRRGFTVPAGARASARAALTAGGLSPMSRLAAELLASGAQVTGADVLWVHRFFDGAGASAAPGDPRLAAWGGADALAWSRGMADRTGYDSMAADAGDFQVGGLEAFTQGFEHTRAFWGRVAGHGHVDAVFREAGDGSGNSLCWGNGTWRPAPKPTAGLIELDDEAAMFACGALFDAPDRPVDLRVLAPDEWAVAASALPHLDFGLLDLVSAPAVVAAADKEYTPEERSKNASTQLRDANGKFAEVGAEGLIKSVGVRGRIASVNEAGNTVVIEADDGNSYMIDPKDFEIGSAAAAPATGSGPDPAKVVKMPDFSQILGQPRAVSTTPKAFLKSVLPPLGKSQLGRILADYERFVIDERQKRAGDFKGGTGWAETRAETPAEKKKRLARERSRDIHIKTYEDFFKKYGPGGTGIVADAGEEEIEAVDAPAPAPGGAGQLNPDESDVKPLHLAIVDEDDPLAVLNLVALVPAGPSDATATTFRRDGGEWVPDPKIAQDLRSPTPPPVVMLNDQDYTNVLAQVDGEGDPVAASAVLSIVSAGGADRNRGNAEDLRRYWTTGEGGAKIAWDTPGDWRRCVRLLSKHLGQRSKGYCALRHREMTGMWPGDRRNRQGFSLYPGGEELSSADELRGLPAAIRASGLMAKADVARRKVLGLGYVPQPPTAADIDAGRSGRAFKIPIVVPEGISSGDKRHFRKGSLGLRSLPLPLLWQPFTGEGHDNSPIVGRIDHVERIEHGLGNAYGVFDTGPYGSEAQRLVENEMLQWVSVDLDKFEVDEESTERDPDGKMDIKKGRMMGATLVPKPAFQECKIELIPLADDVEDNMGESKRFPGVTASAAIAASIPVEPPAAWFQRPVLNGPTPIKVMDNGQVFGHIATWATSHIGLPGQVPPPRSRTSYSYFHTGELRTDDGKDIRVGQLTLSGGHASLDKDAVAAARHYDDTASAVADVHAGEDSIGIWVAGALRPGVTPPQIRAFRASAPSGDWRFIPGVGLEMIAVCQVNVPGFPIPRSLAASGHMNALVAAGTADLVAMMADEQAGTGMEALAAAARQRVFLALDPDGYLAEFKTFPTAKREALAKDGKALPDGSFPIENAADLRRAIQAYGRADEKKQPKVRRHIVKRARALGKADLVPSGWKEASLTDERLGARIKIDSVVASARARQAAAAADRIRRPALQAEASAIAARVAAAVTVKRVEIDPALVPGVDTPDLPSMLMAPPGVGEVAACPLCGAEVTPGPDGVLVGPDGLADHEDGTRHADYFIIPNDGPVL